MDIVPEGMPLTIEARVASADGDDVRPGQKAFVHFDTLHERTLPALKGNVVRISADAFNDEASGASYYTAEIRVPLPELQKIEDLRGSDALRAGVAGDNPDTTAEAHGAAICIRAADRSPSAFI